MTAVSIADIAARVSNSPLSTAIFLGAGSSRPSGAPSASELSEQLTARFFPGDRRRSLTELCTRIEAVNGRRPLVDAVREILQPLQPSGAILQLPHFNFSRIFTTNFDLLVERTYEAAKIELPTIRSNKDFSNDDKIYRTSLYKIHGCVTEDRVDGLNHGMILTEDDYRTYFQYRQICTNTFSTSLAAGNMVFIGYSLSDENIRKFVDDALQWRQTQESPGAIFLIQYERDDVQASIWSRRGATVSFGDLDAFLGAMYEVNTSEAKRPLLSPLNNAPTYAVASRIAANYIDDELRKPSSVGRMVTGTPASFADIAMGLTFPRTVAEHISLQFRRSEYSSVQVILGPSGTGKTTAARQVLLKAQQELGWECYEHKGHMPISLDTWKEIDLDLQRRNKKGLLLLDEMTQFQFAINNLSDFIASGNGRALSLLICAHPAIWRVRTKSSSLSKFAQQHNIASLDNSEINAIVNLIKDNPHFNDVIDPDVRAKDRNKLRDQLKRKTNSDLFVCLKYLFDNRSLDEIVLQEFSQLSTSIDVGEEKAGVGRQSIEPSDVYRVVCFLEAAGRQVHRQMVLRLLELPASAVPDIIDTLDGIVFEEDRDPFEGIYFWRTRHPRIAEIIAEFKFTRKERHALLNKIIENINPAVSCELSFATALCNSKLGLESLPSGDQTAAYQALVDAVPFERVPRHRLIRNLLRERDYGVAEIAVSAARVAKLDDSVISRYDVELTLGKARHLQFLGPSDRLNMLEVACEKSVSGVMKRPDDMYNYQTYCRAALELASASGEPNELVDAIGRLKRGFERIGDPRMNEWIIEFEGELSKLKRQTASDALG